MAQQQSYGYAQQPQMQAQMTTQPPNFLNPKQLKLNKNGERAFDAGLCGCCSDPGHCCMSCFCPCVVYGKNRKRYDALHDNDSPARDVGCCTSGSWCYFLLHFCGISCCLDCGLRGDIRKRYNIEGSACGDCCVSYLCLVCNQQQQRKELQAEEDARLNAAGLGKH